MGTPQDLTLSLLAAGYTKAPEDEGTFLLHEKDNDLYEKLWTGSEEQNETYVASDVKENTPATYLVKPDQRLVFFLNKGNDLECRGYNPSCESWEEETGLPPIDNVEISSESQLSSCLSPLGITVFFQDTDGHLKAISSKNEPWEISKPLPADAVLGTPLTIVIANRQLNLFYMSKDSRLHYLAFDPKTNDWKDKVLEHAIFDRKVDRLAVTVTLETGAFESFCLSENTLYNVNHTGKKMGDVEGDKFISPGNAQAGWFIRYTYSYEYYWWN